MQSQSYHGTNPPTPPHSEQVERAALGTMLLDRSACAEGLQRLQPDHFYVTAHRLIFETVGSMARAGRQVDFITLTAELEAVGRLEVAGGAPYLASLPNVPPTAAMLPDYIGTLEEFRRKRAMLEAGQLLQAAVINGRDDTAIVAAVHLLLDCDKDTPTGAVLVCLADVAPKAVRWLWRGRIPLGKVTVLDGDPDLGKSLLTLDLAARVTQNDPMPDRTVSDLGEPRGVVLLSAEDDAEDTIRPRLDGAGADVGRVVLLARVRDPQGERGPTIADLAALEDAIRQTAAALVIVDPLMAYLPDERDAHRDQDIRRALAPLADLAARTGAAVLVIRHLNKSGGGNPLYRGGGSIGIIGASRSGLLVAPDPDEPDGGRRILVVTKSNLAAKPPALAYHIETLDDVPHLAWDGPTEHTAAALLALRLPEEERSALDDAVAFLDDFLAEGGRTANDVKAAARQAGIADRTLERARLQARVVTRRQGFGPRAIYICEVAPVWWSVKLWSLCSPPPSI